MSEQSQPFGVARHDDRDAAAFDATAFVATPLDGNPTLETVLAAWHEATVRLEQTHEALREQVQRLTDELEAKNRELARKDRLADLGRVATHVAHEVRNDLVPVTLYLSLLRRRISHDPGSLDVLDKVASGFAALDATVNDLLSFTSDRDPQWQSYSLRRMIDELCTLLAPQLSAQAIELALDVPEELVIASDPELLRRAVLNLVLNALDAMPEGGQLTITSIQSNAGIELEVADSGAGLSDDAAARAFEPFFTTKHGGTGLGLAIVHRIAEVHGGDVTARNCPDGGAAFTLKIPQPAEAVLEAAA